MHPRLVAVGTGLLASAATLVSCAQPVAVPVPTPASSAEATACSAVRARLPTRLLGQNQRPVEPDSTYTAAWGRPVITLRCGVPRPAALTPTSELITVDGVDWFGEQLSAGFLFSTVNRTATVEVAVPGRYSPESDALADLASAISASDPLL